MVHQIGEKLREKLDNGKKIYVRYEKFLPAASFFAGFMWDNLTVNRIDAWSDNAILLFYILLLTGLIILMQIDRNSAIENRLLSKYRHLLPSAMQFLFGGLLSTYVVFYFQSASFGKTLIFVFLLMALLIANEFLSKQLANLYLLLSLYFFVTFSFFIFFIPVVSRIMNLFTYILGGIIGLMFPIAVIYFLDRHHIFKSVKIRKRHIGLVFSLYIVFNFFYVLNIIPPVPLSLKDIGIYHYAIRLDDQYILRYDKPPWYAFYRTSDNPFIYSEGDTVFCYTAVFAPGNLTKKILHQWAFYSPVREEWEVTDRTAYLLTGGRDGGYRGFTFKKNVHPGSWRVSVLTEDDLLLGNITFDITQRTEYKNILKEVIK
jgi:hypothetical protein